MQVEKINNKKIMSSACDLVVILSCAYQSNCTLGFISRKSEGQKRLELGSLTKELGMGVSWDKGVRVSASRAKPLLMALSRVHEQNRELDVLYISIKDSCTCTSRTENLKSCSSSQATSY